MAFAATLLFSLVLRVCTTTRLDAPTPLTSRWVRRHSDEVWKLSQSERRVVIRGAVRECSCSASERGYPVLQRRDLALFKELLEELGGLPQHSKRRLAVTDEIILLGDELTKDYGVEGVVNADRAIRMRSITSAAYCVYDAVSQRNLVRDVRTKDSFDYVSLKSCSAFEETRAPSHVVAMLVNATNVVNGENETGAMDEEPQLSVSPVVTPNASSSTVPSKPPLIITSPSASASPITMAQRLNAGCVAVEHIQGHQLQYTRHLLRRVTCWNEICATQHHSLIVNGKWTTMLSLCSQQQQECTEREMYVNNLAIAFTTRLQLTENVIVTPYDARYPIFLCWLAQMVHDSIWLISQSMFMSFIAALLVMANSVVDLWM